MRSRRRGRVAPKTPREILVYGWAPEQASAIVLTAGGRVAGLRAHRVPGRLELRYRLQAAEGVGDRGGV